MIASHQAELTGWGRTPRVPTQALEPADSAALRIAAAGQQSSIARGGGRAYGDAALNRHATLLTRRMDRVLAFDPATGVIECESGIVLRDLIRQMLPQGWFPPVVPGTALVTLGGMVAADIHGKNHHRAGCIGAWVRRLTLLRADGSIATCERAENAALFAATCGGMGLTGVILSVRLQLVPVQSGWIRQHTARAGGLDAVMELFAAAEAGTYSVAWIDCLATGSRAGRSILYRGEHASRADLPPGQPEAPPAGTRLSLGFDMPAIALNRWSLRAFNAAYYAAARPGEALVGWQKFFFPLDAIGQWNRLYGRAGFYQHQSVLPLAASRDGLRALIARAARAGSGAFLAVLKLFGDGIPEGDPEYRPGPLSFPMRGYTLAMDFPAGEASRALLRELDRIVLDHGGRLYLAKDLLQAPEMLRHYPDLARFRAAREAADPDRRFASLQSERLGL